MYGVQIAAGRIEALGEERLIGLYADERDESESGAEEKYTQHPREIRIT
jgi:hypothetical protein